MPIRMYTDTPPSSPPPTSSHPSENQSHQPTNPPSYSTQSLHTNFIPRPDHLSQQILWIGCSDSDCTETTTLNFLPEEMLEHRNLGNMIIPGDLSSEISIRHAVCELRVKHIVVCGHYGCGIVRASSREGLPGLWSSKLDSLHAKHRHHIDLLPVQQRDDVFVELNILDQLRSLRGMAEVEEATRRGELSLHGMVYDPLSGRAVALSEGCSEDV
ncbi:Uncharacterized protein PECH_007526 [Penicillium ucsense]|uniref:Carbonic anhydrase n=1 Tax=Penicillium ucsense TaxID=2839758 RepID=A0A8J8WIE0_9EURO|nr:Uncharacterized protein PECM_004422 [Penicillium ucsense]KAF7738825.1 Uncharacterized protein PECH_007526 [Penicillium ucsense]